MTFLQVLPQLFMDNIWMYSKDKFRIIMVSIRFCFVVRTRYYSIRGLSDGDNKFVTAEREINAMINAGNLFMPYAKIGTLFFFPSVILLKPTSSFRNSANI